MKTQERRDGEAVVIVIALVGVTAVAFVGILLFGILTAWTGPIDGPLDVGLTLLLGLVLAFLVSAPLGYLYRHRRP